MDRFEHVESLLVIMMGGIGNMVLLTPAVKVLGNRFPAARIHYLLAKNGSRQIIELHPQTGHIIEWNGKAAALPRIVAQLRSLHPDLAFTATGTNPLNCGVLGILSGARVRLGESFGAGRFLYTHKVIYDRNAHETDGNLAIARLVMPHAAQPSPEVWVSPEDVGEANSFCAATGSLPPWIGFHIGSGPEMSYKRWPLQRFAELADALHRKLGVPCAFFGGTDERELARKLIAGLGFDALNAAGKLSIRQTFEVLKRCRVFVSNDTGVMHLAAAAGVPVVALFGPTRDEVTGPLGGKHRIVRSQVDCSPCYRGSAMTCEHKKCMMQIQVEPVLEWILRIWAANGRNVLYGELQP